MVIALIVILVLLLAASITTNVLLFKAGETQRQIKEIYESWIEEWRADVLKTYAHMKLLDDKQMFEKDDDVGVVFRDMSILIESLNNKTQEITVEEEE